METTVYTHTDASMIHYGCGLGAACRVSATSYILELWVPPRMLVIKMGACSTRTTLGAQSSHYV